ncbi:MULTISPECIES: class I lanthipeptide [unclassified Pedobacter]|uniref:class I lanthipeptide n=1 Tax=unclassified Pedobacter TaxID=2628915 RepID=UPI000493005E|nr:MULTISPECIES: class I lanthipeptide [unclassified Pedobacter]MCX2582177.1 class I lanthipeptide [Pedobacter sp. MR22-3]
MRNNLSKLALNKETIETLDNAEMNQTTGGFTYSLSLGAVCKQSKSLGADNAFECGKLSAEEEDPIYNEG